MLRITLNNGKKKRRLVRGGGILEYVADSVTELKADQTISLVMFEKSLSAEHKKKKKKSAPVNL